LLNDTDRFSQMEAAMPDDFPDNTSTNGVLPMNGTATGRIEVAGDKDWFAVSLVADEIYRFSIFYEASSIDVGNVYSSDGKQFRLQDTAGITSWANNEFVPTSTGTYYIEVLDPGYSWFEPGNYVVGVRHMEALVGTDGDDFFEWTPSVARIDGMGGNDTVSFATAQRELDARRGDINFGRAAEYFQGVVELTGIENITGTNYNDTIAGTDDDNILRGLDGNDTFEASKRRSSSGQDTMDGGAGWDEVRYLDDNDLSVSLLLGRGLAGSAEGDVLIDIENLYSRFGNDTLVGDDGDNRLESGGGDNFFTGNGGDDTIQGRGGLDTAIFNFNRSEYLFEPQSNHIIYLSHSGADSRDTLRSVDILRFADGDVTVGQVVGTAGNDWLEWIVPIHDRADGGDGVDMVTFAYAQGRVAVNLGQNLVWLGDGGTHDLTGFENVTGTSFDDVILGSNGPNWLRGLGGNDTLQGGAGADILDGGAGLDEVSFSGSAVAVHASLFRGRGWGGDAEGDQFISVEQLTGSRFDDRLDGSNGADSLFGGEGNDTLTGIGGDDYINGHTGTDTAVFGYARDQYTVDVQYFRVIVDYVGPGSGDGTDTLDHIENLRFADGDLYLGVRGTSGADILTGADGWFRGFAGNDLFLAAGTGVGRYDGGAGVDTVDYSTASAGISASLFRGRGWGGDAQGDVFTSIENLTGSNHDDMIWGDNGNNRLEGLHGDDTITGAGGDDYILAGFGTDVIVYSGNRADYRIDHADIRTEVEHLNGGVDGFDVIGHAEILRFADGDFIL
jgi:Ca2+-binding RTX toxin-like protein